MFCKQSVYGRSTQIAFRAFFSRFVLAKIVEGLFSCLVMLIYFVNFLLVPDKIFIKKMEKAKASCFNFFLGN